MIDGLFARGIGGFGAGTKGLFARGFLTAGGGGGGGTVAATFLTLFRRLRRRTR